MNASSFIVLIILVACLAAVLAITFRLYRNRFGNVIAWKYVFQELGLLAILAAFLIVVAIPLATGIGIDTARTVIFFIGSIGLWILTILSARSGPTADKVLLDLGTLDLLPQPFTKIIGTLGALAILFSILASQHQTGDILTGIFFSSLALFYLVQTKARMLVSERGIHIGATCLKWEEIEDYKWTTGRGLLDLLTLNLKHRLVPSNQRFYRILRSQRSELNELLEHYATNPKIPETPRVTTR